MFDKNAQIPARPRVFAAAATAAAHGAGTDQPAGAYESIRANMQRAAQQAGNQRNKTLQHLWRSAWPLCAAGSAAAYFFIEQVLMPKTV